MSQVFHDIEKKIIISLKENPKQTPEILQKSTNLSPDQIRRGIEWLKLKNLALVYETKTSMIEKILFLLYFSFRKIIPKNTLNIG